MKYFHCQSCNVNRRSTSRSPAAFLPPVQKQQYFFILVLDVEIKWRSENMKTRVHRKPTITGVCIYWKSLCSPLNMPVFSGYIVCSSKQHRREAQTS